MMDRIFGGYGAALFPVIQGQGFMPFAMPVRWVKADMVLGNPHAGCRGAGICKISVHQHQPVPTTCDCERKFVVLTYVNKSCIRLILEKKSLSYAQYIKHFRNNKVAVHKFIPLSYQLCIVLGYPTDTGIDVQNIDVYEDSSYYYLFVQVSRNR